MAGSRRRHGREIGAGHVDVGYQNFDPLGPALGQVNARLVLVVFDAREQGGQVLGRVVGLEPGGLVADEGVAEGVAPVEAIVREGLDDVEQHLADPPPVPGRLASGLELFPFQSHNLADLLAGSLTQVVRFGQGVTRELLGQQHELFLVHAQSVGVAEHRFHVGVLVGHGFAAVLPVGIVVVHVGGHGARPVKGVDGGDVLELSRRQGPQQVAHGAALELKDPDGVAPAQQLVDDRVVQRTASMSGRSPVDSSIRSRARSITERLRRPRKSILSKPRSSTPCISYWVTIGASSGRPPGSGLRWMGR